SLFLACVASQVRPKPDTTEVSGAEIPVVSAFRRTLRARLNRDINDLSVSTAAASSPSPLRALVTIAGSGAAAGAAIAVRPNLALLAIVPAVIAIWPVTGADKWRALRGLAVFGLACAPFVLFVAWFYNNL